MLIGVPKEIKQHEYRVGLMPDIAAELIRRGHQVWVEAGAGSGAGFPDALYQAVGAKIITDVTQIFQSADMIIKVKEPQPQECALLRENQILFTYLHLAPDRRQTEALIKSKCIAIAYETVTDAQGGLPLLAPMSEIAGRMSIQIGARFLEKPQGGRGVLLGGAPGVKPGRVAILGGGAVGTSAARVAIGMGAQVAIVDRSPKRLRELDLIFNGRAETLYSTHEVIERLINKADLVIGATLVHGASSPKLVTKSMLKQMKHGSVIVDVSIDQGGCFETSRVTTHTEPTYVVDQVVHYCVGNMPGAVARTATFALNYATMPFVLALADHGYLGAMKRDMHLKRGLNVYKGHVTHEGVSESLGLTYHDPDSLLNG